MLLYEIVTRHTMELSGFNLGGEIIDGLLVAAIDWTSSVTNSAEISEVTVY